MGVLLRIFIALVLSALDALWAWWLVPAAALDLGYWDWFKVSVVFTGMVSSALIAHDLHDE